MTKPVIVKRSVKGSALTFTELDTNFQNLDDATITLKAGSGGTDVVSDLNGVITLVATDGISLTGNNTSKEIAIDASLVRDTTPQLGGNLDVNGYSIVSTSNANIVIEPNGTGDVQINADTIRVGDLNTTTSIVNNGTGNFTVSHATGGGVLFFNSGGSVSLAGSGIAGTTAIGDNINAHQTTILGGTDGIVLSTYSGNASTITISGAANGNITLAPDGTGDVRLDADTVRVGDSGAAATITTNGAGNLILSTNAGTNSSVFTLTQGANANATLVMNGTGNFIVTGANVGQRTNSNGGAVLGRVLTTTGGTYLYPGLATQKSRTDILTAAMTLEPAVIAFQVRDSAQVTTNFGRLACTYQGSATNPFWRFSASPDGFTTEVVSVIFGGGVANWGSSGTYTHTTTGTTDLILSTNGGSNSGTITINDGANSNIEIATNGTGDVYLTADTVRVGDLDSGALITSNGTGAIKLNTNGGTNSGEILVNQGVNANIELTPNGTGSVLFGNSSGTNIADFNTSRVLTNVAIRGNVTTGATVSKGGTYTIGTTEKQYLELEITNTGAGSNIVLEVTNLTVSGTGGHYAVLVYNNSGSSMDLDILNNGVTLSTASKNMPNGSRHICTIYCVGNYAAVETMDAV